MSNFFLRYSDDLINCIDLVNSTTKQTYFMLEQGYSGEYELHNVIKDKTVIYGSFAEALEDLMFLYRAYNTGLKE